MPMHLISSVSGPSPIENNAISRLRYSLPRRSGRSGRAIPPSGPDQGSSASTEFDAEGPTDLAGDDFAPHGTGPDHVADRAQAEREDLELVTLAAAKLAGALREVQVLLRGDRASRRVEALTRCTAKGWITVHGDPLAVGQTFRVTPEGYRAAGLRVPPFIA